MYKNKRNKKTQSFMVYTDFIVDKYFDKDLMRLFGFQKFELVSNKLAALIQPKCLINEIEKVKVDIARLRLGNDNTETDGSITQASQRNLISSWENSYRNYIERLSDIEKYVELARSTLYENYNKDIFTKYTSFIENLIILENFLRKSNSLITTAFLKSRTGKSNDEEDDFFQDQMVTNLIKQVKPRDRKLLFPENESSFSELSMVNKRTQK
jgi:hypothetical protein